MVHTYFLSGKENIGMIAESTLIYICEAAFTHPVPDIDIYSMLHAGGSGAEALRHGMAHVGSVRSVTDFHNFI